MALTKSEPAFLFDLDGVLIDSKKFHFEAWAYLSQENPLLTMDFEKFAQTFGMRNEEILNLYLKNATPELVRKAGIRKEELFRERCKDNIQLLEGMQPFLEAIKSANLKRIIASSTPRKNLEFFLKETLLGDYFDFFVSAEEVRYGKPSPDVFLEAARRLKNDPKNCIVLEDSPHGLVAGRHAGCFVLALETTTPECLLKPRDVLYKTPKDLNLNDVLNHYYAM